nr:multidrug efflux MFS transporter [Floricoccus penangensis]
MTISEEDSSLYWKKNLYVTWLGSFFTAASISLVMPFISLYIEELGVPRGSLELMSGIAVSISPLASGLIAPVWGRLADQKGRKVMLVRASFVMTFTMAALAFVPNVWWLLAMRLLNGLFSGYIPNSIALIASQVPKEKSGYALGTLSTGAVAGSLIGPTLGGTLAQLFGMREVFLISSVFLLIVTILTVVLVKENFKPVSSEQLMSTKEVLDEIPNKSILFALFLTSFLVPVAFQSVVPIMTLYIRELSGNSANLMFIAGLIVSAPGLSAIMSSSWLGRIGDKIGSHRLMIAGLIYSFATVFPMAFATTPLQLGILRFLLGFGTGAILPSVNSLLTKITPSEGIGRIFSFNQAFNYFGQVAGPMLGSLVAYLGGYSQVFIITSVTILINLLVVLISFKKYLKVKDITNAG